MGDGFVSGPGRQPWEGFAVEVVGGGGEVRPQRAPGVDPGTWPDATVQCSVVHMVRNSLRYASRKHWPAITRQMRAIYEAPTLESAEAGFEEFFDQWKTFYPAMIGAWEARTRRLGQ